MPALPHIRNVRLVDSTGADYGVPGNELVVDPVGTFDSNGTLTYDASNNPTQVVMVIGSQTITTSMAFDASNNLTSTAKVVT